MNIRIIALLLLTLLSQVVNSQENITISEARKNSVIEILNYRFKGGYYSFEKAFAKNAIYPEAAKYNCIVGIAIVKVVVDCKGVISELKVQNPLGYGIEDAISMFFNSTEGQWNTCKDDKYTTMVIPIQFVLKGTETNTTDALLICEESKEGVSCNDDEYYIKRIEKYKKKGNKKKLLHYLSIMMQRDPYNNEYSDLRSKILSGEDF